MDLLDSLGETLGGVWDSAMQGGEQWVQSWFDNEADKVASAAPEQNRVPQYLEPAKQPTGQPIQPTGMDTQTMLLIGGGVVVSLAVVVLLMKGK
ncbi:hypothetical protein ACFFLZ_06405 [Photobacterium aphoticum]|uniref:Uncharacterized protein n=1 Tax=Photobacterium aphoticum TaxID=754436 RepID=A0A0J1GRD2_9GAMM|nr:hypothetical protein [Photobacterium aphoticum]KLV01994.1 hypothetical protein ABT58_06310 [Photobacterium aphoticum]PSU60240.1 hypothetical protein C9I90_01065 [Photobacterium aphoticum]GHA34297.1 hypothetical protein GCM10007086_04660 [Photobacterium aphoticum]